MSLREDKMARIEDDYQDGYDDGYNDGYDDGCRAKQKVGLERCLEELEALAHYLELGGQFHDVAGLGPVAVQGGLMMLHEAMGLLENKLEEA